MEKEKYITFCQWCHIYQTRAICKNKSGEFFTIHTFVINSCENSEPETWIFRGKILNNWNPNDYTREMPVFIDRDSKIKPILDPKRDQFNLIEQGLAIDINTIELPFTIHKEKQQIFL